MLSYRLTNGAGRSGRPHPELRMFENLRALAEKICAVPSVSGFEGAFADLVCSLLEGSVDSARRDRLGNVIAAREGRGGKKLNLLFEAHMDQIGLIITKIEENGVIRFSNIGGINPLTLFGKRVKVFGKETFFGVIGMKPPHIAAEEELSAVETLDKLYIDAGSRTRMESERLVSVGDVALLDYHSSALSGDHFASSGLDDKAGVLTLLSCAGLLGAMKAYHDVTFLFSVQEEVGLRGAKVGGYTLAPDAAVVCDVTFGDPMSDARGTVPEVVTGKGPAISKGPGYYPPLVKRLCEIAKREDIPVQEEIEAAPGGTDAFVIQTAKRGVYTGGISVPLRYMHSQTEIINLKDVYRASKLLALLAMEEDPLGNGDVKGEKARGSG